jgi:hypothetical protein
MPKKIKIRCAIHGVSNWRYDIICGNCGAIYRAINTNPDTPTDCDECGLRLKPPERPGGVVFGTGGTAIPLCHLCVVGAPPSRPNPRQRAY